MIARYAKDKEKGDIKRYFEMLRKTEMVPFSDVNWREISGLALPGVNPKVFLAFSIPTPGTLCGFSVYDSPLVAKVDTYTPLSGGEDLHISSITARGLYEVLRTTHTSEQYMRNFVRKIKGQPLLPPKVDEHFEAIVLDDVVGNSLRIAPDCPVIPIRPSEDYQKFKEAVYNTTWR